MTRNQFLALFPLPPLIRLQAEGGSPSDIKTVWRDDKGVLSYKWWALGDAFYAQADPDYYITVVPDSFPADYANEVFGESYAEDWIYEGGDPTKCTNLNTQ